MDADFAAALEFPSVAATTASTSAAGSKSGGSKQHKNRHSGLDGQQSTALEEGLVLPTAGAGDGSGAQKKKKLGGFAAFGLSREVFAGIKRMGYNQPTPIQRRSLPVSLSGRDVVAMARTGSGKTAAFLIPLLEKLEAHSATVGARGLVLSPTRELAQQTHRFGAKMAKFVSLRLCLLQGGDSMTAQFEALTNNPDIIVATPGRLVHLLGEVPGFGLKRVEMLVVDEADRIFEMGFALQLKEVLGKLSEQRQTLLFSATMPTQLVEFARAGLEDPELIRLDSETRLSEQLKLGFFTVRSKEKLAALVYLLTEVVSRSDLTIVFAATRHHVEFIHDVLKVACDIQCSVAYGSMDMLARKTNLERFRTGRNKVLVVTDVAARGLDIPLLNNVVNFDFPAKAKLFVHRVGRAARQGRAGAAFSLVTHDEVPFMVDLHLYLGRPIRGYQSAASPASPYQKMAAQLSNKSNNSTDKAESSLPPTSQPQPQPQPRGYGLTSMTSDDVDVGRLPQEVLDAEMERWELLLAREPELQAMERVVANAQGLYARTRPEASRRSVRRSKELGASPAVHPLFVSGRSAAGVQLDAALERLKGFRPQLTVFELENAKKGKTKALAPSALAMVKKRRAHSGVIALEKDRRRRADEREAGEEAERLEARRSQQDGADQDKADEEDLARVRKRARALTEARDQDDDQGQGRAAHGKRRVSKAARKRLKKSGAAATAAVDAADAATDAAADAAGLADDEEVAELTQLTTQVGGTEKSYRDEAFYIASEPAAYDAEATAQLSTRTTNGREEPSHASRLEDALLSLGGDDEKHLMTQQRSYHWDKRKKKYIKASMEEHQKAKRVKNEAGGIIRLKDRGALYDKWQKSSGKAHAAVGSSEPGERDGDGDGDGVGDRDRDGAGASGKGKGKGKGGKQGGRLLKPSKAGTDVSKLAKAQLETRRAEALERKQRKPGAGGAGELKGAEDILKDRNEKQKRRDKNGRLPRAQRSGEYDKRRPGAAGGRPTPPPKRQRGQPGVERNSRSRAVAVRPKHKRSKNKK